MKSKIIIQILAALIICVSCNPDEYERDTVGHDFVVDSFSDSEEVEGPNLLKDGSLERWWGAIDGLVDWPSGDICDVKRSSNIVFDGRFSAMMKSRGAGITARLEQVVPVTPGGKIRIRFKYYVEKWKENGARTYCYFRTRSTESSSIPIAELRDFYTKDEYYIIRGGGFAKKYLPHSINIWHTFDEIIKVPPTANYFEFGVSSYYGTTIYIDDCYVFDLSKNEYN